MRSAAVYLNNVKAGALFETSDGYAFQYAPPFLNLSTARPISLTLPLAERPHRSAYLFPFFVGLLPEGYNRTMQCRLLKIDENDDFGLLLTVAHTDTIGAVRVISQ